MNRPPHDARKQGALARRNGIPLQHNPYGGYRQHEHLADEWKAGWLEEDNTYGEVIQR